ncbi:uncharacterized protein BKA78DRAFT_115538 [Phyllosticta capitalensis]|uniref:uncharacterized protein n=1 Tax=Phyllosticta capitalensis TaxID=121624 RepID=UPI00312F79F6
MPRGAKSIFPGYIFGRSEGITMTMALHRANGFSDSCLFRFARLYPSPHRCLYYFGASRAVPQSILIASVPLRSLLYLIAPHSPPPRLFLSISRQILCRVCGRNPKRDLGPSETGERDSSGGASNRQTEPNQARLFVVHSTNVSISCGEQIRCDQVRGSCLTSGRSHQESCSPRCCFKTPAFFLNENKKSFGYLHDRLPCYFGSKNLLHRSGTGTKCSRMRFVDARLSHV